MITGLESARLLQSSAAVAQSNAPRASAPAQDPFMILRSAVDEFTAGFESADRRLTALSRTLPADAKPLLEAQMLMSRVHLQAELLTRVVDGAGATIRRLQQTAAG